MKEDDDMLELLDEEELEADSEDSDDLELTDDSDDESLDDTEDDSLELDEPDDSDEPDEAGESEDEEEEEEPEKEGIVLDVRLIAVAAVAVIAILIGIVFLALPMMADNPPQVTFTPSQAGEDLFLTHAGGDKLEQQYLTVLINGAPLSADKYLLMGGGTWPWSQGTVMRIDTSGFAKPAPVSLTYKPKSIDHFVYGTNVEATPTPTPTPTPIIPDPMSGNGTVSPVTSVDVNGTQAVTPAGGVQTPVATTAPPVEILVVEPPVSSDLVVMNAQPSSGSAPLAVQFTDQTSGCIRNRVWNFGDGQTSMKRSPSHVYPYPGTYNATLDVRFCDPDDNPAVLPVQSITVNPFVRQDCISQGTGVAEVLAGAKFFFSVKGPGTNIRIGGRDRYLETGDDAEIILGSDGAGDISIVSGAILRCNYSNATLIVNGEEVETGTISVINIDRYLMLETADVNIKILAGKDGAKGLVGGEPVINAAPGQQILLKNVGVDSTGKFFFSVQDAAGYNFRGGIESYEVTTPPPL